MTPIYKICSRDEWAAAERTGQYEGSELDRRDGFIHLSGPDQVRRTAQLHFSGRNDLVLVVLDAVRLNPPPVWEPSRGGVLFPHLYGHLPVSAAIEVRPLTVDAEASELAGIVP